MRAAQRDGVQRIVLVAIDALAARSGTDHPRFAPRHGVDRAGLRGRTRSPTRSVVNLTASSPTSRRERGDTRVGANVSAHEWVGRQYGRPDLAGKRWSRDPAS